MSVKLRLRRDGAKKRPFYHLVAADERCARNGRFIEQLGYYNPIVAADAEPILVLKEDRVRYWLGVGAQPSETAAALLKKVGILERRVAAPKTSSASVVGASTAAQAAPDASVAAETSATTETTPDADAPVVSASTTQETPVAESAPDAAPSDALSVSAE